VNTAASGLWGCAPSDCSTPMEGDLELSQHSVNLVGHLVWPITIIAAGILFRHPISKLVERITKVSAFKVNVELGHLSQARSLSATVESLKKIVVTESLLAQIVAGVIKSGSADYVLVDIGKDNEEEWLTSRLFLLSAFLERSRAARCLVFLGENQKFLGAATPRDVRSSLGARFLAYESALASAYGGLAAADQNIFRGGLSETLVNLLTTSFLRNQSISRPDYNPPNPEIGWVKLERQPPSPTTWEFADWVTAGSLREIHGLLTGSVVASVGPASPETMKSIATAVGSFVALIRKDGSFVELCDRNSVLEYVAREAIEQSSHIDTETPRKRPSLARSKQYGSASKAESE
jgi:hypothetical protein